MFLLIKLIIWWPDYLKFFKVSTTIKKNITTIHWSAFPKQYHVVHSLGLTQSHEVVGGQRWYKEVTKSETAYPSLGFVFTSGKYSLGLHFTYPMPGVHLIYGCLSLAKGLPMWKTCLTNVLILNCYGLSWASRSGNKSVDVGGLIHYRFYSFY